VREYSGAVEPALEGLLKIVTNARIKPTIIAGNISVGMFQPIKAPPKQRDSKMPVLLTAPSKVILSLEGISPENPLKFLVKAGFADLPNLFIAVCLDECVLRNLFIGVCLDICMLRVK
jgi:hypothetical protein